MSLEAFSGKVSSKVECFRVSRNQWSSLPPTKVGAGIRQLWQSFTVWKVSKHGFFGGPHFPVFGLNAEIYSVKLHIWSEYRKIQTKKNSLFGHSSRSVYIHDSGQYLALLKFKSCISPWFITLKARWLCSWLSCLKQNNRPCDIKLKKGMLSSVLQPYGRKWSCMKNFIYFIYLHFF